MELNTESISHVKTSWWALKIALGVGPIVAGIDKYFNKLADWEMYLSPAVTRLLPVSASTFMHTVGLIEIAAGVVVLSRWTRIGAYLVMAWLLAIACNLITTGMFYDLAVRDVEIAVGAFVLAELSAARATEHAGATESSTPHHLPA